jgi:hypothetical protein
MNIWVKTLKNENHIYTVDNAMRPLKVDVVSKNNTKSFITSMVSLNKFNDILFLDKIDFSKNNEYFIDHIL